MKELLNVFRTYLNDLKLLNLHHPITNISTLEKSLKSNIEQLKKEHWDMPNYKEILYQLKKHFDLNRDNYLDYFNYVLKNYKRECLEDVSDYYVGRCCLLLKPFWFVVFCSKFVKLDLVDKLREIEGKLLNIGKVVELNREMGFPMGEFRFLRQGMLLKLSRRRGLQPRVFFLFEEVLSYGSRISSLQGFRLHGVIQTSQMEMEEGNEVKGIPNSFVVNVGGSSGGLEDEKKVLVLAGFSEEDKASWVSALTTAISKNTPTTTPTNYHNSSDEFGDSTATQRINQVHQTHRSNQTTHVCWHRNLSVSREFLLRAYESTTSGYLLRKFKNSSGWQRLWVVYTSISLYFYKSHDDTTLLASLPLLGYKVSLPDDEDCIAKPHVFKLHFKSHTYFFRAESPYTFQRWLQAIRLGKCATKEPV